jgi:hypothetical protein
MRRKHLFYTYIYFRKNGTPYYVGKGSGFRVICKQRLTSVPDRARILVEHWDSEERAFEMEKWYIRLFGRKDNGTGILRNRTDGGDGASGAIKSEETRRKTSVSMKINGHVPPSTPEGRRKGGLKNVASGHLIRLGHLAHQSGRLAAMVAKIPLEVKRANGLRLGRWAVESGQLAEARLKSPIFNRTHEQWSEAGKHAMHIRWHVNRNINNPACLECQKL